MLTLSTLLLATGCTFFKYGTCQPFGGGQSKIVNLSMYDPRMANPTNRLAAWAYYDAKYRASHIITDPDGNPMILSEVPPDVATTIERVLTLSATATNFGSLALSNALHASVVKLADRTPTVELLRDGGYNIRELAFNNRLHGSVTNTTATLGKHGIKITTSIVPGVADQRLQQLFSVIQAVETSRIGEQVERAKAAGIYVDYCRANTNALDKSIIALLLGVEPPSSNVQVHQTNQVSSP